MSESKSEAKRINPHIHTDYVKKPSAFMKILKDFLFDLAILFANIVVFIFFREVSVRGSFNVPKKGATIVVVAPHANQFVDGAVILTQLRSLVNRNSPPIIAESSYKGGFIGSLAKLADAIPVPRVQDNLKFVPGEISIKDNDYSKIYGKNTKFTSFGKGGLIGLPESAGNAEIADIISDTEIVLKKPFKQTEKASYFLENGTKFKYASKISTDETFRHVFSALHNGGMITIFPEGGSHDRTELLPIKAGFAIMALGAVAGDPDQPVNIIPTGLNYFHRNKFRSRAVVEFGTPITVTSKEGQAYKENPREAVAKLLDEVTAALKSVTVTAPDYETLMVIQAARRLYSKKVPLSAINVINRNLVTGYTHYKDHPKIIQLKQNVIDYNKKLVSLGLKDHQVELTNRNALESLGILIVRTAKLFFLFLLSFPGTILFLPIFIVTDNVSKKKQKKALAASVVKIKGDDVVATWKIIVATVLAPSLYITYSITGTYLTKKYDIFGYGSYSIFYLFVLIYLTLVLTTYAAFRIGEAGVDILKSLPPLFHAVFGPGEELEKLKDTRRTLQLEITETVNDLGPKVFPDFDKFLRGRRYIPEFEDDEYEYRGRSKAKATTNEDILENASASTAEYRSLSVSSTSSGTSVGLSRVNSAGYLSDIPILGDGGDDSYDYLARPRKLDRLNSIYGVQNSGTDTDTSIKLRNALRERIKQSNGDEDAEEY